MKKIYTFMCIAATLLAACSKEAIVENDANPQDGEVKYIDVTFGAEFAAAVDEDGTKTMLNEDLSVSWCAGDQIAVNNNGWDGGKKGMDLNTFTGVVSSTDSHRATFSGKINSSAEKFIAVYPASNVKLGSLAWDLGVDSNGLIYMILPNSQTAKEGSFTNGCALSYAIGDVNDGNMPNSVEFKNLCALLEFTMPDYVIGAKTVNIKSNNGTKMSGGCVLDRGTTSIGFKSFGPSDHFDRAVYDYVTVTAPNTANKFYAVIFPGNYSGGFTITVTTADGQVYSRNVARTLDAKANHIYNLGTLGVVLDEGKVSPTVTIEQNLSTGSIATLNMTVSDVFKDMVTKWTVELCDKNGTVIRKAEITDGKFSNVVMSVVDGHTLIPAGDYTVKVSYNMPSGSTRKVSKTFTATAPQFNVTVTALTAESNLVYSGDVLTGTNIKVTSFTTDVLPEIAAKIEWVNFNLKDANGTLYRTSTGLNDVMTVQNGLPYIPNGTYKLTAGFLLTELGGTDIAETAPFDVTISHTPTFGVSLTGAKTSYDYYKAGNASQANACSNMGIYELAANVTGISDAVKTQMAGKFSYEWFLDGNSIGKTENSNASVSGISQNTNAAVKVAYGNKNVKCRTTFDGIGKESGNIAVNITGLPYNPNNEGMQNYAGDWTVSGGSSKKEDGCFFLRNNATATFKGFYIPADVNTTISYFIEGYVSTRLNDHTTVFTAAGVNIVNEKKSGTATWTEYKSTKDITFTTSQKTMTLASKGKSSSWATAQVKAHRISVVYR